MSSATEKYNSFEFDSNEKWTSYSQELYPMPRGAYLEKFKRKWYTSNIDKEFDLDFDGLLGRIQELNKIKENMSSKLEESKEEEQIIRETSESESVKNLGEEEEIKETKETEKRPETANEQPDIANMNEQQYKEFLKKHNVNMPEYKPMSMTEIFTKSALDAELFAVV